MLDSTWRGRVATERKMSAGFVAVREIARQNLRQVGFVEHDHVIQTLAPDQANQSLNVGALPW